MQIGEFNRCRSACIEPTAAVQLIAHHFKLDQIIQAYETFGRAADTKALKVIIEA